MDVLPTQDTASITLLPRPYSNVVDIEKDHPNMLYVAKDVRGITPYALTFNDVGSSMLNEGGLIMIIGPLVLFIIMIPALLIDLFSEGLVEIVLGIVLILMFFVLP
ncbi:MULTISPECIES: hypothetical protein, partial [unclassified Psychrobacter]